MKLPYILLLATIPVSVYGSRVEKLLDGANEANIVSCFVEAQKGGRADEFVKTLIDYRKHNLLNALGNSAHPFISINEKTVGALVEAYSPEMFKDFFASHMNYNREEIIKHLVSQKALKTLKAIWEHASFLIYLDDKAMEFLHSEEPELLKDLFERSFSPDERSKIVNFLVKKTRVYDVLMLIGDNACEFIPIGKESIQTLYEEKKRNDDLGWFNTLVEFRTNPSDWNNIINHLVSLEAYDALEVLGTHTSYHLPLTEDSVKVIVEIDDLDIAKGFYKRLRPSGYGFTKETFIEKIKELGAYDEFKDVDPRRK